MRVVGTAILILSICGPLLAQTESSDPAELAWFAYRAGKSGDREVIPRLVQLLDADPDPHLRHAVLDALIQLDAKVPGDFDGKLLLEPEDDEFLGPAVLLLAKDPEANQTVLATLFERGFHSCVDNRTVAIGNLLADTRAPDFALRIFSALHIVWEVHAVDSGTRAEPIYGREECVRRAEWIRTPRGFPPLVRYQFWDDAAPDRKLLCDAPFPVWTSRVEIARRAFAGGLDNCLRLRSTCTLGWLGHMLDDESPSISFPGFPPFRVVFDGRESYERQMRESRARHLAPWVDLLDRCLRAKLFTPQEAWKIEFPLTASLQDLREDQSTALPTVVLPSRVLLKPDWRKYWLFAPRRGHRNLRANGGSHLTEAAVDTGLDWLDRCQEESGCWDSELSLVNTSFALLAYLGAAHTDREGDHQLAVGRALDWLIDQQGESGRFGRVDSEHALYDHALATLAMAEALGLTGDPVLRESTVRALDHLRATRADWLRDPTAAVWAFLAFHTAWVSRIEVAEEEFDVFQPQFKSWAQSTYSLSGPRFPNDKATLLACNVICRERRKHFWEYNVRKDPIVPAATEAIFPPQGISQWCFGAQFMYRIGGRNMRDWNDHMKKTLLPLQVKEGAEWGSWNPEDFDDTGLGRIGVTANLITCLQMYYRYGMCF